MTQSDDWESVDYHNLPHWLKRVSKPKQWVTKTYTKIFYSKPYDYKVQYKVIQGKLRTDYWRSYHQPDPIPPSETSSKRLKSYHYLLVILITVGLCFVVMTQFKPSTTVASLDIQTQIINVSQEIISDVKVQEPRTQEIERFIFELTNKERQKNGLKSLTLDTNLASIARKHSQDMVDNNYFDHINLVGDGPGERAIKAGYLTAKGYRLGLAENIGKMPTGNVIGVGYVSNTPESIAEAQMKRWMESAGHRLNILDNSYDKIGVGVAYDGHYYIATQDFW